MNTSQRRLSLVVACSLVAACGGSEDPRPVRPGDGGADSAPDVVDGGDGGETGPAFCPWAPAASALTLPTSASDTVEVRGVLGGPSRNVSTTCTRQRGTGGPEAVFLVHIPQRTVLDLEVLSGLDTVLAIRRVCQDPLTEVACNDTPAAIPTTGDAGFFPPFVPDAGVVESRDARLRAALAPGTYYVIVDEAEAFGVGGPFTLKVKTSVPPQQASCFSALTVTDGASLPGEMLDLAAEPAPACDGGVVRRALYYAVTIPGGQRLAVRVRPLGGDRSWRPVVQMLAACPAAGGGCLGVGTAGPSGEEVLRYVNNAAADQTAVIAVSAGNEVAGAVFRLEVDINAPVANGTCATARALSDGLFLRHQALEESNAGQSACGFGGGPTLFYSARLLPHQTLRGRVSPSNGFGGAPIFTTLYEGCKSVTCDNPGQEFSFTNGPDVRTMILEVSTFAGAVPVPVFDLSVEMPLPPGAIEVTPRAGLTTSEAGGQSSFEVVLRSPPRDPMTLALSSSDAKEGTVSPATLLFDSNTWDKPQKVTVTGVDDAVADGARAFSVRLGPAVSGDPRYQGLVVPDVELTNFDDEPGFRFVGVPIGTSESGRSARVEVHLNRAPSAPVRLPLRSSDPGEGRALVTELLWEVATWKQPKSFTVEGVNDDLHDGPQAYRIVTGPAVSSDPAWSGLDPGDLDARNVDDDFETMAARPLNENDLDCTDISGGGGLATDEAGTLYVMMVCRPSRLGGPADAGAPDARPAFDLGQPPGADAGPDFIDLQIFVRTSSDGARTFSALKPIAVGHEARLVGGPPGRAAVLVGGPKGLALLRTVDGGLTWNSEAFSRDAAELHLASRGDRLTAFAVDQGLHTVWSSQDFGTTWLKTRVIVPPGLVRGLGIDGAGAIMLVVYDGILRLLKSSDAGRTFALGATVGLSEPAEIAVFGASNLYGSDRMSHLWEAPLADPTMVTRVPGLTEGNGELTIAVHPNEGVTVLDLLPSSSTLVARHRPPGAQMFSPARTITTNQENLAFMTALSDKAVAVLVPRFGRLWLSVEVFP